MRLTQRQEPENSAEDPLNNNGDQERAGKPGNQSLAARVQGRGRDKWVALKLGFDPPGSPAVPWCPAGWVGYLRKCYYFSEAEGNWTYSQSNCSSFGASLATIDTLQQKAFMLRYKGLSEHWIGLRREEGEPWRWANGAEFNNLLPIRGGGDCAYLNDKNVSSSRCITERNWVCSKPDAFTSQKNAIQSSQELKNLPTSY
ncbi:unnamed protein product [Caretta caretta]